MRNDGLFDVFVVVGLGALIIFTGATLIGLGDSRAESTYSGQAVDFENERGLLLQTTQVHVKTDDRSSKSETFCVHPENRSEQVDVLRDATRNGDRVTITYSRPRFVPIWTCESDTSIIRDIEVHDGG